MFLLRYMSHLSLSEQLSQLSSPQNGKHSPFRERTNTGPRAGERSRATKSRPERSFSLVQVEPVRVHHLGPGRDEIVDEPLSPVTLRVDLGIGAQDRV